MGLAGSWNVPAACFWRGMAMNRAQVAAIACGVCGSLPRRRAAAASDGAYAGIRRHVQTMLWVRACHSAMV